MTIGGLSTRLRTMWKPLVVVSALVSLLTYLLLESRSADLALRARMYDRLQTLALHDAELTRDVLRARAGLLPNYDSLAHIGRQLRDALDALHRETAALPPEAARDIGPSVERLDAAIEDKLVLVEYFKADNALLRNSSTYFAHAGRQLGEGGRAGASAPPAEVTALLQAILRFMQSPDVAGQDEARRILARMGQAAAPLPVAAALATHGRLIVEVLPGVDELVRQVTSAPIPVRIEALDAVILKHATRIEARAQVFRVLLYLLAVMLAGYVLYQFRRLQTSARVVRRANVSLEREVAERRQAEAALRTSEERFRAITESANDAIISVDGDGRIVSWNAKAEEIFGYRSDEILGASLDRLMPSRHQRRAGSRFARRAVGRGLRWAGRTLELAGRRRDGTEFPLELSLSTWSAGQGRYVTAMIRDLTSRKRLEETTRQQELQLIQADKMTTLGTLVSGIAHEINSPNQLVMTNAGLLGEAWGDVVKILDSRDSEELTLAGLPYVEMRATLPTLVQDVLDGARRIQRIVADLKDFARPPARGIKTAFDLNEVVQRALRLLGHSIGSRTDRLELSLGDGVPPLQGDVQQIEQVVVNLVMNALEALPDRGHGVHIATRFEPLEEAAVVEVADEGVGIAPEHLGRVFDPFFTTKRESGGTGLGLAIAASLVRAHGGRLTFSSKPGRGTRAVVALPVRPPGEGSEAPAAAPVSARDGGRGSA
jgi:PAS domain S-box-containing protein